MAYRQTTPLARSLTDWEEEAFRQHARENDPPADTDPSLLHPVCRDEWVQLGKMDASVLTDRERSGFVRVVTCGCCTNGCCCHHHQDTPRGRPPRTCELHS